MKFHAWQHVFTVFIFAFASCDKKQNDKTQPSIDSLALRYTVLSTLPHNSEAFTEGLVIYGDKILESTGLSGQSWIAEVDWSSGQHEKKIILDDRYFGEGITVLNDKLYHLTYRDKIGFTYQFPSYKKIGEFNYNTEGWGITHDNRNLIMSDGTHKLYFLDTVNFNVAKTLQVTDQAGRSVTNLNELEYIHDYIFANVWETALILKIDPKNGKVVGRIDLSALENENKSMNPNDNVLNGIAYDKRSDALLVTGKRWPKSYLIRLQY